MRYDTERLQREIMKKGWTYTFVAEKADITVSALSKILSGANNPSGRGRGGRPENIKRLAKILGIPMDELVIEAVER